MTRRPAFAACAVILLLSARPSGAQPPGVSADASRIDSRIVIDGVLDDSGWAGARPLNGFRQRDPDEGAPSSESTEVRVVYTSTAIIFGIVAHDREPARITATELRRDNAFDNDDSVAVLLDTLHDHRSAYLFRVNPAGTQYDALITDEGKVTDANWDESWIAAARVSAAGWTAEIEIPFKILRLTGSDAQVWGLDVERIIRRKSEFTYWSNYRRSFTFAQVSQAGHLNGVQGVDAGTAVRVKPYIRTTTRHSSPAPVGRGQLVSLSDIGLEDVKYRVTSDFTVDFTANTDFAEADVDAQVLNVTRFPVFFPERREFFVEGAGIFDFGPGGGAASEMKLFFSRSIGLSPERETIPILAGAKMTGKAAGWSIGILDVQTDALGRTPRRNHAVVRIKKDLLARSNVGVIFNNRDSTTPGDPYNRGFGADANFILLDHLNLQAFAASTYSPGKRDDHWAGRIRTNWDTDRWFANFEHLFIQRDVNPEMGWLPRRDMRKTKLQLDFKPRPDIPHVRQLFFRTNVDYITNQAGDLETRNKDLTAEALFQSGDRVFVRYSDLFDRLDQSFRIQGLPVSEGSYQWKSTIVRFTPSSNRSLSGELSLRRQAGFYGGDNTEVTWSPLWKPSENLSLAPIYQLTRLELPSGRFTSHLVNSQVNYAFSNRWLTSTTVQYNSLTRFAVANVRLNYIYRPGDDVFVIYNDSSTLGTSLLPATRNRSFILKVTRSLDF